MAAYKVEICGVDTSKLKVLKADEMRALFARLDAGDKSARQELVQGNLRLVLSIIQRFSARGENPDDLFQVGCVGLLKSIDNFDTSMNVRFSTYAVPMIIGEIRRYLRDNNSIRVSRSLRDIAYKALGVREAMLKQTGNEPRVEQIAETLGAAARGRCGGARCDRRTRVVVRAGLIATAGTRSTSSISFATKSRGKSRG